MYVLGIETSCDETAAAVLSADESSCRIASELLSSQSKVHELYGGVVPELAAREHMAALPILTSEVLAAAGITLQKVEAIAVSRGPGLRGCLLMGLNFAKGLSLARNIPLVSINHIEAHLLAPMLDNSSLDFPFLALVVSGGHTELHLVTGVGEYQPISRTIDDAAGEAFDKSANLLGFSYPGGASLAALADTVQKSRFKLPLVMRESEGFSFSGLKTAIALLIKENQSNLSDEAIRAELAYAVQRAIVDALIFKVKQALERTRVKKLVITGGVSANRALRNAAIAIPGINVFFPIQEHCTDNAAMVAYLGWRRFVGGERSHAGEPVMDRWPVESMRPPQNER
ncbi:MAG: tRNA (adenosine(37)-N6)-threonylcarbamoyltransferase complex transferase subunit TsaD [Deltaproteobacteria bacterium]|nr:tRNA (adenosine(37)-N6)-threonylcarbamoyltransferase complex transferase subunit TsaD [Deltaproteobacteria bacterium]